MTRESFIRKYLGNKRYEYNNADIDLMREDLDKVIDYHALRQPDVIKSVCQKCGAEMEGATYKGYKMCHVCREWQTVL